MPAIPEVDIANHLTTDSMGIDIYAHWHGHTQEERDHQVTGFSVVHGHVGYLREAYHGEPYATRYLVSDAFDSTLNGAVIPAATLRQRLPKTLELVRERERTVYGETDPEAIAEVERSFIDFVELCEAKEAATGTCVTIEASW